mmetsp:Transcript_22910/g.71153  ORF Transcript_22910/g.71153 Transcript_22910/m.71153 type:complete len:141 (+) Transcript_22910:522-944(+)
MLLLEGWPIPPTPALQSPLAEICTQACTLSWRCARLSLSGDPGVQSAHNTNHGKAHLGHVFGDGPDSQHGGCGHRHCINGRSLIFEPILEQSPIDGPPPEEESSPPEEESSAAEAGTPETEGDPASTTPASAAPTPTVGE